MLNHHLKKSSVKFVQVYSEAECTLRGIQPSMILLVEMNSGYSLTAKCTFNLVDVVGVVDFQRYNGTNAKKEEKYAMSVFVFLKRGVPILFVGNIFPTNY